MGSKNYLRRLGTRAFFFLLYFFPFLALTAHGAETVVSWGDNSNDQRNIPAGLSNVVALAAGDNHAVALKRDGTVVAWGAYSTAQTNVPVGLTNVKAVAAGSGFSVALKKDGTLVLWSTSITSWPPGLVAGVSNVTAIGAGSTFLAALRTDGTVLVIAPSRPYLQPPPGLSNIVSIAGGVQHVLAVRNDGRVFSWGLNGYGQTNVPPSATNVIAVTGGFDYSIAARADGTLVGWGDNSSGQLSFPATATNVIALASYPTMALRRDGTVVAWGTNYNGATNVPAGLTNVFAIAGVNSAGFAVKDSAGLFITDPLSAFIRLGSNCIFSINATGQWPITYQWESNGTAISDATNSFLTFNNVQQTNAGDYRVIVSNPSGSVTSQVATLTIDETPLILSHPTNQTREVGQSAAFEVNVYSVAPVFYQWQHDGTNIAGATNATFAIDNLQLSDDGAYRVVITNTSGTATSLAATLVVNAATTPFNWLRVPNPPDFSIVYAMDSDSAGNVYVTGYFDTELTFGTTTLRGSNYLDMFLVKFNQHGEVLWAQHSGGTTNMEVDGIDVAVDKFGNAYVTGYFYKEAQFGTNHLFTLNPNNYDIFIVKYSPDGEVLWAQSGGSDSFDDWPKVAVDDNGNVFLAGYLGNPGMFGTNVFPHSGYFLMKLDPDGRALWARQAENETGAAGGLAVDMAGNCVLVGNFRQSTINVGGIVLTNASDQADFFIAKYDGHGNVLWAKRAGGSGAGYTTCCIQGNDYGETVAVDTEGNCYAAVDFTAVTEFEGQLITANPTNGNVYSSVLAKYSPTGQLLWARQISRAVCEVLDVKIAPDGHLYLTGGFSGNVAFGATRLSGAGMMIAKYDRSTGECLWAKPVDGPVTGWGLSVDRQGIIFVGGEITSGPFQFGTTTVPNGTYRAFVARFEPDQPLLDILCTGGQTRVSWLTNWSAYLFESSTDLSDWSPTNASGVIGNEHILTPPSSEARRFFRLRKP